MTNERPFDPTRAITVVSGLPRSGTSLMMQMLDAAGVEIARDDSRPSDEDNPRGYFELSAVRRLPQDASFVDGLRGRAVKIVAPLLRYLPEDFDYRVIFMERDLDEVLASQAVMLRRRSGEEPAADDESLARAFERELRQAKALLAGNPRMHSCFVAHARVVATPVEASARVESFLESTGGLGARAGETGERERLVMRMAEVVDARLHRQRRSESVRA